MMKSTKINCLLLSLLFVSFILGSFSCGSNHKITMRIPANWYMPQESLMYEGGIDDEASVEGKHVATIKSITDVTDSTQFGVMSQTCNAKQFLGKRIRFRGFIKTKDVKGWAGLWLRIDQQDSSRMKYFDNMDDRGVTSTSPWKPYEIVLDVPEDAISMSFGALLSGVGQMWFGNLSMDTVGADIPTTGKYTETYPLAANNSPKSDTVDYEHMNKAELEKEYRGARHASRECMPVSSGIPDRWPDLSNLGFEK